MSDDGNAAGGSSFKDRSTGLMAFGIILLLMGALSAAMVLLMGASVMAVANAVDGSAQQLNASAMIPVLFFYAALAVWFIWMGIGSIKARRWARALVLVTSWMWLVVGIMALFVMMAMMPDMYDQMSKTGKVPEEAIAVVKAVTIVFMAIFYIVVPGAFVLFYGSRHVKATCERLDGKVRWTDKCPLPVLAMSLASGFWALCMPNMGLYGWAFPFFGVILNGTAGACLALVFMLLLVYVAVGSYWLDIKAWWCALLIVITWGVSAVVIFSRIGLMELYQKMDYSEQQLEAVKGFAESMGSCMVWMSGLWGVIILLYLLYTRKFFKQPETRNIMYRDVQ